MEASVDRVVGLLQRAALWLAGTFMLLQTRTIRNKITNNKQGSWIFVAAVQQTVLAVDVDGAPRPLARNDAAFCAY